MGWVTILGMIDIWLNKKLIIGNSGQFIVSRGKVDGANELYTNA